MPFCKKCGEKMEEDGSICKSCGAPESPSEAAQPESAPKNPFEAPPLYSGPPAVPGKNTFVNSYLSIVVFAVFFIGMLTTGVISAPGSLNILGMLNIFFPCALIAMTAVISTRAKGLDFSVSAMMMLSSGIAVVIYSSSGSLILAICAAIFVCSAVGLVNGVLITYLRIPAIITTLLVGVIVVPSVHYLIVGNASLAVKNIMDVRLAGISVWGLGMLVIAFAAVFLLVMLTKLGVPKYKRDKKPAISYMFAYAVSAAVASLAGLLDLFYIGIARSSVNTEYVPLTLLVFACIAGSRILDNRTAPAIYALAPAMYYVIMRVTLFSLQINSELFYILRYIQVLIFVAIAFIARHFFIPRGSQAELVNTGVD